MNISGENRGQSPVTSNTENDTATTTEETASTTPEIATSTETILP